VKIIEIQTIAT